MITGFNTDVEHEGVVYHVQTEDKGVKSPLILSLVYVGGTILASKRTPYDDLVAAGYDEKVLAERLQRQHKLICAAIRAGRIEDLKRQTERESAARAQASEPEQRIAEPEVQKEVVASPPSPEVIELGSVADFMPPSIFMSPPVTESGITAPLTPPAPEVTPPSPDAGLEQVDYSEAGDTATTDDLQISLLEEKKFIAGEFAKIQLHIGRGQGGRSSVPNAAVTMKVLGSSFRPLIFSGKTGNDGKVIFYAMLPYFTSGRAAILVSVQDKNRKGELRRVIHQAGGREE